MGGEKFHITVTIDNEKALQIADFLNVPALIISLPLNTSAITDFGKKTTRRLIPSRRSDLKFFCHVQPLMVRRLSDFLSADICVSALAL
jgi:hypothetical protein